MVQVSVGWGGEFQGTEADIVKCFVIDTESLVGVFDQLMNRQSGIVRLNNEG